MSADQELEEFRESFRKGLIDPGFPNIAYPDSLMYFMHEFKKSLYIIGEKFDLLAEKYESKRKK